MSRNRRTLSSFPAKLGILLIAAITSISLVAQQAPKPELSEKVSESIQAIGKKIVEEPRDLDGAINDINALLAQVKPDSFDTAYLTQLKAQAYINKQDYASTIPLLETVYRLAKEYKYFGVEQELGVTWMLAQLYVQDASMEKNAEIQKGKFAKALSMVREWLSKTKKPTFEAYHYAASILYQQATGGGSGAEVDKELLKQAAQECQNALTMSIRAREQIYQLLVAIAQAANDYETATKYLELMVAANPKSAQYWTMLLSMYLGSAEGLPEGSFLRNDAYARAVYTIERAQANGFMTAPGDYQRKLACYFNSGQFEGTVDILEDGLRNGKVENTQKNWELLSSCYLQLNRTQKAIDALVDASKIFKDSGDLDMQIGYLYYGNEQYQKALEFMKVARDKGVDKNRTASLLFFIGYLHFELKELDEALASVEKALEVDANNQNAREVQRAIKEAIDDRNRNLKKDEPAEKKEGDAKAGEQTKNAQQPAK
ncbi:tetratricopeptide (TPR) repeat protein [Ereboglobus sp. PH5-5]|uniref:tetratricopeptide repeat protein n=1 Tax=Ereboglobus sp. PH5-5 TaxID=2940529 RepID=UPI002406E9E4|nr:hypothetical protein [Ereboglobus sp. PH5-5]MDF9834139.1 tetratricopeptide (TPR) repeat protein [Ereboglobus sp. PH5-5]